MQSFHPGLRRRPATGQQRGSAVPTIHQANAQGLPAGNGFMLIVWGGKNAMTTGYLLPLSEIVQPSVSAGMPASVLSQSASILQSGGLSITSQSDNALNGVYPADNITVAFLLSIQNFIDRNARFPGGTGQYVVPDSSGNPHIFTTAIVSGGASPPSFTQLVYALADFAALCSAVAITGTGTLPLATASIS